ncbi:MAG: glycosyltransferase [Alphaproteobacteria bacterium]
MKKIFVLIGSLGLGGTEKQLFLKIKKLKDKFNFSIILFYKKGELLNDFEKLNVEIIDMTEESKLPMMKYFIFFFKLLSLIKEKRPNIIHFYLPHSYLIAGWTSFFFPNINFLMSRRSLNLYQKKIIFINFIEKHLLHKKMRLIFANSLAIKDQLVNEEFVEKSKVKLVYNSIEINNVKKKKSKSNCISVLFLANLIPYKNHNLIIDAVRILPKDLNYKIKVVGSGDESYRSKLLEKIRLYNLIDKFEFYGGVKNPEKLLAQSQIGILCSNEEGLSNSIIEYMNYRLPVIATSVGGNAELVKTNFNGFLIKKGDAKGLALKLELLIRNSDLRFRLGENGFSILKEKFSTKNILYYQRVYSKL